MPLVEPVKVSCILVCYNQQEHILEALTSLASQTYRNIEIIISDDCSTDSTFAIIKKFIREADKEFQSKCTYVNSNSVNLGLVHNFQNAFNRCSGEIVCVFAGDDVSDKHRISATVHAMTDPDIMAFTSDVLCIDVNSRPVPQFQRRFIPGTFNFEQFAKRFDSQSELVFNGCSAAYRNSVVIPLANRPIETEDFTLYVSSLIRGKVSFDDRKLVMYRVNNPKQVTVLHGFISRLIQLDHLLSVTLYENIDIESCRSIYKRRITKEILKNLYELKIWKAFTLSLCLYL